MPARIQHQSDSINSRLRVQGLETPASPSVLFVDTRLCREGPVLKFTLVEPQSDLSLCGLYGVTTVDDVTSHVNGVVSPYGAGFRTQWVCFTKHGTTLSNSFLSFPYHGHYRSR